MATSQAVAVRLEKKASAPKVKTFLRHYFYFCMSLVMAAMIVGGFSKTVDVGLIHANPPRPLLLWFHGAAFSTWVVLFITQSALVRVHKVSVHKLLGWFGAGLATSMVVLGCTTTVVMTRFDTFVLHQKNPRAFVSIPFFDMLVFGTCMALAIYWRKRPEYHRRLVFVATAQLMDAGIGRFDFVFNHNLFYPGLDLLIVAGMLRDWYVDGRVNKVYLYALPAIIPLQALAVYVWRVDPVWWQAITQKILA